MMTPAASDPAIDPALLTQIQAIQRRFGIIGTSAPLLHAIQRAVQVAPTDLSVLIYGQSGTGKEFFPKIIHHTGARKHNKYIAVNCGAIPEGTIDSELFGHEKGSFTGAISPRKGYFEEADGGTIFLDEIAELPLTTQARLLRVLETGEYLKVGSSHVQKTDIRIIAATNTDLTRAISQGRFREDLYYRLSTVTIQVPPLASRDGDILLLTRKFATDFAERYMTPPVTFSPEANRLLLTYPWPGNVRQLKNTIDRAALFHAGQTVGPSELAAELPTPDRHPLATTQAVPTYADEREILWQTLLSLKTQIQQLTHGTGAPHEPDAETTHTEPHTPLIQYTDLTTPPAQTLPSLRQTEADTIRQALLRNAGNRKKTAAQLNISERTLYRKIREYNLET